MAPGVPLHVLDVAVDAWSGAMLPLAAVPSAWWGFGVGLVLVLVGRDLVGCITYILQKASQLMYM